MKLIIAGSRHLTPSANFINELTEQFFIRKDIEEIVSGNAHGVDFAGEEFSIEFLDQEAKSFPADWSRGVSAGHARNKQMAAYADALLLIWDGKSHGSANMKEEMMKQKKPIYEIIVKGPQ